jgi:Holliday junction resolvase-like predicted endonuclease
VDITNFTRKDIGNLGEKVAAEYLRRNSFVIVDKNVRRKTGEIDIIAKKASILYFVEVKSLMCNEFPNARSKDHYDPAFNLHKDKIRKVTRTAEWYVTNNDWEGGVASGRSTRVDPRP